MKSEKRLDLGFFQQGGHVHYGLGRTYDGGKIYPNP